MSLDSLYSINPEFTGEKSKQFVVIFCGKWAERSHNKELTEDIATNHNNNRT